METIFSFLLRASFGIALFYLVYWIFLGKETFYKANRWFLLAALLTAVLLPLFPISYTVITELNSGTTAYKTIADTFKNIPNANVDKSTSESFRWEYAVLLVYLTGVAIFLLRLLSQTTILIYLMIKYRVKSLDGIRIVENEKYALPFSFFNVVFINPKFHTQDDLPEILAHEKVHIRENHWFDLLFIELLTVIFWFNPFIWFFERSIKQNHEYLADEGVLAQGHNVGRYQALLINQLMGMQIIGITNNLNFALSKNRLKMMTKTKTSRRSGIKFAWALPVIALLLFAFSEPSYQLKANDEPIIENTNPDPPLQKSDKEFVINGKVIDAETGEPLAGASIVIKGTPIGTVADKDGTFVLTDLNPDVDEQTGALSSEIVVSFVGKESFEGQVGASGKAIENGTYTFKLEDKIFVILTELSPPPPPVKNAEPANGATIRRPPPPPPPPPTPPVSSGNGEVFYIVEEMPKYPGGIDELKVFVNKLTKNYKIKGEATIGFTVNAKGKVTDIKIVKKDNDDVGKAGAEIVSQLPDWTPGKQRGKGVSVKYVMLIYFE